MWPRAALYLLKNPAASPEGTEPTLLHTFDDYQGLLGIAEIAPDTFAVVASKFSGMAAVVANGSAVWEVSLQDVANPKVRKVTDLPEGGFLNGMVKLHSSGCRNVQPADRKTVLISDSFNGAVYKVNTNTGAYEVAVKVPEMDPIEGAALPFGVNGIKIVGHFLYWANSDHTSINRVAIDMATGVMRQGAKVETLVTLKDTAFLDEFDIDEDGTIWGRHQRRQHARRHAPQARDRRLRDRARLQDGDDPRRRHLGPLRQGRRQPPHAVHHDRRRERRARQRHQDGAGQARGGGYSGIPELAVDLTLLSVVTIVL
ncbi:hypothetical protein PG994_013405 [Apiospora phragmitis]|uniref:Uncharacterized protein n=1 Tax=Apiospora phragmitis TaxID=2905665 RepID=A0ABR1T913_9PEZI